MRALDVMASGGFLLSNKRIIQFIWNFTVIMKIVVLMEKYISWILGNVTRIPRHELPQTLDFSDFLPLFT